LQKEILYSLANCKFRKEFLRKYRKKLNPDLICDNLEEDADEGEV
jgi:hypothetical protein